MSHFLNSRNQSNLTLIDSIRASYIRIANFEHEVLDRTSQNPMNLFTLLDEQTVIPNLEVKNKKQVINTMIDLLGAKISEEALAKVREDVFEREAVMSTGVGKGLAIPHCKTKAVDENYAVFAKLDKPLDYDSIDGEPVQIIFLLVGPDTKQSHHIKLLSRISRLMNSASFREKIVDSQTSEIILEAFKQEEEKYFVN